VDGHQETLKRLTSEDKVLRQGQVRQFFLASRAVTNVPQQDDERRLQNEIAELDAALDRCQEVKRGTLNKIRQHREASTALDREITETGMLYYVIWKQERLTKKRRGKNSPVEQSNSYIDRGCQATESVARGGCPHV